MDTAYARANIKKRYLGRKSKKRTTLIISGPRQAPKYHAISSLRNTLEISFLKSFEEKECIVVSRVPKPTLKSIITNVNIP
jgi:hypothetical protein